MFTFNKTILGITMLGTLLITPMSYSFAQAPKPAPKFLDGFTEVGKIGTASGVKDFKGSPIEFVKAILKVVLSIVAIAAVAVLVYGGFVYLTSAGAEEKAKRGKQIIVYAVFGLLLIAASALIVNVIINTFFAAPPPPKP